MNVNGLHAATLAIDRCTFSSARPDSLVIQIVKHNRSCNRSSSVPTARRTKNAFQNLRTVTNGVESGISSLKGCPAKQFACVRKTAMRHCFGIFGEDKKSRPAAEDGCEVRELIRHICVLFDTVHLEANR